MNKILYEKKIFYPWLICFSGLLILVVINGLTTTSLSVFDNAFISEFHWKRDELKLRESITNSVTLFFILVSGIIIDKIRVKKMMLFGSLILAIALFSYSFVTNKYQAYFIHFLLGVSMITAGSVSCIILVSSWFQEKKGLALGIVLSGTSLGSAIFSPFNHYLLHEYGWRQSFTFLAIFPVLIFIYIYFFVENSPNDVDIKPLGNLNTVNNLLTEGMTYPEATRTHLFWLICLCGFLTFYCLVGTIANIFLHLVGLGFTEKRTSFYLGLYFIIALFAKLFVSIFSDYINPYLVFSICCIMMILGFFGLTMMDTALILPSITLMAVSWGGIYSLYNIIAIKTFGLKAAGKINGTINMFEGGGALLGPVMTGFVFNLNHSYQLAFMINAGLMFIVLLLSLRFKAFMLKLRKPIIE
ncbi:MULTISPECIES: MFS transporter [unclassified Arcicella]|uniref:MFS transporter n=1 Tax=unclassified Arcicella TaxID=2644986 RepID=UPI00285C7718|nr:MULTISPECIES: MFS transporter [unclassified Arcicella]MDR6561634.1 MFS family permease [Arcicella sp. BE51]MDR6812414.1 MFS family permease [Arcicella sp. BE140]MDR6823814.1 MFS family permease [Arcicella sp. BE139]